MRPSARVVTLVQESIVRLAHQFHQILAGHTNDYLQERSSTPPLARIVTRFCVSVRPPRPLLRMLARQKSDAMALVQRSEGSEC
jgi:hypothetical protein